MVMFLKFIVHNKSFELFGVYAGCVKVGGGCKPAGNQARKGKLITFPPFAITVVLPLSKVLILHAFQCSCSLGNSKRLELFLEALHYDEHMPPQSKAEAKILLTGLKSLLWYKK